MCGATTCSRNIASWRRHISSRYQACAAGSQPPTRILAPSTINTEGRRASHSIQAMIGQKGKQRDHDARPAALTCLTFYIDQGRHQRCYFRPSGTTYRAQSCIYCEVDPNCFQRISQGLHSYSHKIEHKETRYACGQSPIPKTEIPTLYIYN